MTILYDSDFLRYPEVKRHPILKGLEPYEKILVRNAPDGFWRARFFSHYTEQGTTGTYAYAVTTGSHYPFAIRYKGNEKYANTAFAAEFADIPQDGEKFKLIEIKSRPGTFVKLDADVAAKIGNWGWHLNDKGYAKAHLPGSKGKGKKVHLSRAVMWATTGQWPPKGKMMDHINHDILDNRMENLRIVTDSLNNRNQLKREGTVSKYKGVRLHKDYHKNAWRGHVCLRIDGKPIYICGSITPDETIAAMAYDCLTDLIGGFLLPNFPALSFKEKWEAIGEPQRNQILHSLAKHGIQPKQ